jgi:hypothetical protein
MSIWDKQRRSRILNELKREVIDILCLNVLEIMNRNEQELYKDIKRVAIALEKLVKLITKMAKENG